METRVYWLSFIDNEDLSCLGCCVIEVTSDDVEQMPPHPDEERRWCLAASAIAKEMECTPSKRCKVVGGRIDDHKEYKENPNRYPKNRLMSETEVVKLGAHKTAAVFDEKGHCVSKQELPTTGSVWD